jgi:hypothetical protein
VLQRFRTRAIFETLFRLSDTKPEFGFSDLDERLPEGEKALLAAALFADEHGGDSVTYEQAVEAMRSLAAVEKKVRREEVVTRIKQAEKSGNLEEALRLTGELDG